MMQRRLCTVDVFSRQPFLGNPVAVVLDAGDLDTAAMQAMARWMNLSETTFLLPPTRTGADYRLRIFTPVRELPFAGHPTLGAAHAALEAGLIEPRYGRVLQECGAGLVPVRVDQDPGRLHFQVPRHGLAAVAPGPAARLTAALGLSGALAFQRIDVGAVWLTAALDSAGTVLGLEPDMDRLAGLSRELEATGVTVYGPDPGADPPGYEVRSFAPAAGAPEDPVCGSGNACVALHRQAAGMAGNYGARQGRALGRDGRIFVSYGYDGIEIGGDCVTVVAGTLRA